MGLESLENGEEKEAHPLPKPQREIHFNYDVAATRQTFLRSYRRKKSPLLNYDSRYAARVPNCRPAY